MRIGIVAVLAWVMAGAPGTVAAAERVPIEAFARFSPISSPRLAPDGKHIAVSADLGEGSHALLVYRIDGMQRTAYLRFPRYEMPAQVAWVSDRRLVIAKGRKTGSLEIPRPMGEIIATNLDGTAQKYIYGYEQSTRTAGLERGFGYIEGLPEQPNGHFYMRRLSLDSRRSSLYEVDTEHATHRLVADIDVPDLEFVLDHSGTPRYAYGSDDDDNPRLYRADANGKNWAPVPAPQAGGDWVPFAFSPDNRQLFGWLGVDGGPIHLVRSDADGGQPQVLAGDDFASVSDLQWSHAPAQPFAARIGAGPPRLTYFDPDSIDAAIHRALTQAYPGHYIDVIDQSLDGNTILLKIGSDRDPGDWYLYERGRNKVFKLLSAREGIDPARMGERRPIRFAASDGLQLDGVLTMPADAAEPGPLPMVLLPHGGPHVSGDGWDFDTDAQFLASRGYLVLQVNFRGSLGRGAKFERAGYLQWGKRIQDDLLDGVRWTIDQGLADPQRICVYGASFGAYSAMMTAARAPELFKCAVGMAGIYDLRMMYSKGDIKGSASGRNYLARVIGRNDAELQADSPVTQAARIRAPVLLVHGEDDERAPFAQAKAMRAALEQAGHPPQWLAVPKEGHGFYSEDNNIAFYRTLEAFIDRHIGTAGPG